MADIITTLHANKRPDLLLYPQIKSDNIPAKAISYDKLDDDVIKLLPIVIESIDNPTTLLKYIMIDGIIYEI